ncbi:hypothetical protein BAUCODRAFT_114700 [Baudoinia panamericana UAMH 10762]|uniref:Uncharacterized protein n=1 Tax=Baudoinia panamericana (strain UAMH 10762) TaxID=717646 RepID=M2N1G4_BAUPA|nr:uncharacterized protein BAUCODRAFT_114700 [Baudoinia panamericana UAMH 10762]EMC92784.1 hypothetical protein BAUCODRAFT_114700 [Baudoinia panamericana UAMH 10762]
MAGNERYRFGRYSNIPIPSYEEATSSHSVVRDEEGDHGYTERQGLLGQAHDRYQPPTVESARTSLGSEEDDNEELRLPEIHGEDERRQVEELDYLDPTAPDTSRRSPRLYHRTRLRRAKWSQQLSSIGATLSSFRLPSWRLYSSRIRIPERYRMSGPNFARLCGLLTLIGVIYVLFAFNVFPNNMRHGLGAHFDPESVRAFVQENISPDKIRSMLSHITGFDHVAGTEGDLYLARWMQDQWTEQGGFDEVNMRQYQVYLNYPSERSLSIVAPDNKRWTAALEEDAVYTNRQQSEAFHGYSRNDDVEGHLIYANMGKREDFAYLHDHAIVTNGSIALVRHGATETDFSVKVRAAEEAGCVGVLIYSDMRSGEDAKTWQPTDDMIQRGSVSMTSLVLGDPLTPGWASERNAGREPKDGNPGLPSIPSLPLAWRDAKILVKALQGHGESVPASWTLASGEGFASDWYTGAAPSETDGDVPIVHLQNLNDGNSLQPIWNVHGLIEGLETQQKKIVVGNHRDAWCFGAAEPGSGSAVMMEVVRIFGELRTLGWRPLRSVEFVSWDAGEYNLVGSTEYVEDSLDDVRKDVMAYINIDVGVSGGLFRASGSPLWQRALLHVLDRINDPDSNNTRSLKQAWDSKASQLEGLAATGDYVAFQDIAGTSSVDVGFRDGSASGEEHFPIGSCYDTLEWMETYGDPVTFSRHGALAQVLALLILEIADRPIVPFDLRVYANALQQWAETLEQDVVELYAAQTGLQSSGADGVKAETGFTLQPLKDALSDMSQKASIFHQFEDVWTGQIMGTGGLESTQLGFQRLEYNDRVAHFDTMLLDLEPSETCPHGGVPGRCQYKHIVFGPRRWARHSFGSFPFIRDAVEDGRWTDAQSAVERAATVLNEAGKKLLV